MNRHSLYFIEPGVVEVREELIPEPGSNQVLVRTLLSGISSGTEMLIYQGNFPDNMILDEGIEAISGTATLSELGIVTALGAGASGPRARRACFLHLRGFWNVRKWPLFRTLRMSWEAPPCLSMYSDGWRASSCRCVHASVNMSRSSK